MPWQISTSTRQWPPGVKRNVMNTCFLYYQLRPFYGARRFRISIRCGAGKSKRLAEPTETNRRLPKSFVGGAGYPILSIWRRRIRAAGRAHPFDLWTAGKGKAVAKHETSTGHMNQILWKANVNVFDLSKADRETLLSYWAEHRIDCLVRNVCDLKQKYDESKHVSTDIYDEFDWRVLKIAEVIGVTTIWSCKANLRSPSCQCESDDLRGIWWDVEDPHAFCTDIKRSTSHSNRRPPATSSSNEQPQPVHEKPAESNLSARSQLVWATLRRWAWQTFVFHFSTQFSTLYATWYISSHPKYSISSPRESCQRWKSSERDRDAKQHCRRVDLTSTLVRPSHPSH